MRFILNDKQGLLSTRSAEIAVSRAETVFSKFGARVKSVSLTVEDMNGPRGGIDKICRVLVRLQGARDIAVSAKDQSLSKAIPRALERAARSVVRLVGKKELRGRGYQGAFAEA